MSRPGSLATPAGAPAATPAAEYHAAVQALGERGRFGIRLGLARTRALLTALGDPQLSVDPRGTLDPLALVMHPTDLLAELGVADGPSAR